MLRLSCKLMDVESVGDFSVSELSHLVINPTYLPALKNPKKLVRRLKSSTLENVVICVSFTVCPYGLRRF